MKNKKPYKKPETTVSFAELEMGKMPPQALELEEAVLGALMLEKEALTSVIDILQEDAFYKEGHKKIFAAIKTPFRTFGTYRYFNGYKRTEKKRRTGNLLAEHITFLS